MWHSEKHNRKKDNLKNNYTGKKKKLHWAQDPQLTVNGHKGSYGDQCSKTGKHFHNGKVGTSENLLLHSSIVKYIKYLS